MNIEQTGREQDKNRLLSRQENKTIKGWIGSHDSRWQQTSRQQETSRREKTSRRKKTSLLVTEY